MNLTIVEKILLAAYDLENDGETPFTAERLIVEAWRNDKGAFGLQGYSDDFPDSNRVLTKITGSEGLKGKGWIEKVREKQYRLTALGQKAARSLGSQDQTGSARAGDIHREYLPIVARLLKSPALKKKQDGGEQDIIFRDACNFWGISSYSSASTLRNRFTEIRDLLEVLDKSVAASGTREIILPEMKITINRQVVNSLRETHSLLQRKFFNELEVIRKRDDERRGLG